jgi:hypothetical protein
MNNPNPTVTESAILTSAVEAVCPTCNSSIAAESDETEIYCEECKCVIFQLPIYTKEFNQKGEKNGLYTTAR